MNELLNSINFKKIIFNEIIYDSKTILHAIDHLAKYLKKNIISESPFVIMATFNHVKTVIAYYAILKAGKIAVILDPESKNIELSEIIEDVDPGAILFLNSKTERFNYSEEIVFRRQNKA
ncbi:MAG: AMP-binding protein, partial [Bacteroidales bacterium]|nr:AMP-binding protein [Bacteroidales bacterium]